MPVIFIIALVLVFLCQGIISMTRGGRHIRAVGGDITAARRAGLPTERIKFLSLLASAFGASVGGILYVGKLAPTQINRAEFFRCPNRTQPDCHRLGNDGRVTVQRRVHPQVSLRKINPRHVHLKTVRKVLI